MADGQFGALLRGERAGAQVARGRVGHRPHLGRRIGLLVKMDQHGRAPSLISLRIDLAMNSADRRGEM